MCYEKKKLLSYRLVLLLILIVGIIAPKIVYNSPLNRAEIVEENCYTNEYDESNNRTVCRLTVTLVRPLHPCYITVAFYDVKGQLLAEKTASLDGWDNTRSVSFYIDGKVASYKITDCDGDTSDAFVVALLIVIVDIINAAIFMWSLMLSCKEVRYRDNVIVVYSGWYHRYMKVNGELRCTQSAMSKWCYIFAVIPIYFDCVLDDGTCISAKINAFNRISLKINGRLYKEELNGYDGKDNYDRV